MSSTMSSSAGASSMLRPYLKPEQPPGMTDTRRPPVSTGTPSWLRKPRTCSAATSLRCKATVNWGCWVVSMVRPPACMIRRAWTQCQRRGAPDPRNRSLDGDPAPPRMAWIEGDGQASANGDPTGEGVCHRPLGGKVRAPGDQVSSAEGRQLTQQVRTPERDQHGGPARGRPLDQ